MRFPAAIAPKQPLRNAAARHPHLFRRLVSAHRAPQAEPAPVRQTQREDDELPAALDERVRLVGEW